jgi:hypothetical protein
LAINRGHWATESVHYLIDWNYDEDRSRIRTGFGPQNITRLRRFALGILKSFQKPAQSIAKLMRTLCFRNRLPRRKWSPRVLTKSVLMFVWHSFGHSALGRQPLLNSIPDN